MPLDITTLLVAVSLATAFCAVARVVLWRLHPGLPGLGRWAAAGLFGAISLGLITLREQLPEILSMTLSQVLIAAGFLVAWDGFRRFIGKTPLSSRVLALVAVPVLLPAILSNFEHSLRMHSSSNAILVAALSGLIARDLLKGATASQLSTRAIGWMYAVNAVFFAFRFGAVVSGGEVLLKSGGGPMAAATLLWWLCMTVAITLAMMLMVGERLKVDLIQQASRDPLTGALNRRAFGVVAVKEAARARRSSEPLSVLMMDLDHFKQVNDRLGHAVGDALLCLFVEQAGRVLRTEDVFCRFGGEEFVALLPSTATEGARAVADRLRAAYRAAAGSVAAGLDFVPSVSIGVAELAGEDSIEAVLHRADLAMYQAKADGRDRVVAGLGASQAALI